MRLGDHTERLDHAATRLVQPTRSSGVLGAVTAVLSIAGDAALLALLVLRAEHARSTGPQLALLGGTLLGEQAVAGALKHGVRRNRPQEDARPPVALHPKGPGFPSGHTSSGFYAATALADRSTYGALYAGATLVALARLHQGVHRASDLLVGAALGTAGGAVARKTARQHGL